VEIGPSWKASAVPRPYPPEFRARAVALVRAGRPISRVAAELGISEGGLHKWVRQDRVDRGELPGVTTSESPELRRARQRIRELELQVEILTRASAFLAEERPHPKEFTR
jgi:transposase-like protein